LQYIAERGWLISIIIFIAMFLEGDVVLFSAFYLANLGHLNALILILIGIIGVTFGDMVWYKIGEHLEKRSPVFRKIAARITKTWDQRLQNYPVSTLCVTKFTYGIHHAILLRAGAIRLSFKKYMWTMFSAATVWTAVIGGFAYFSSASIDLFKKYVKYGEVGLLIGIIIFFVLMHLLSKIGKRGIKEEIK
jgi:membrane protein DedA with SNARE-associated domain